MERAGWTYLSAMRGMLVFHDVEVRQTNHCTRSITENGATPEWCRAVSNCFVMFDADGVAVQSASEPFEPRSFFFQASRCSESDNAAALYRPTRPSSAVGSCSPLSCRSWQWNRARDSSMISRARACACARGRGHSDSMRLPLGLQPLVTCFRQVKLLGGPSEAAPSTFGRPRPCSRNHSRGERFRWRHSGTIRLRQPGTTRRGAGRLRRRTRAPERLLRSACRRRREESRQPGLAAVRRPAPRRHHLLWDSADVA
jgi:hypothetical protein